MDEVEAVPRRGAALLSEHIGAKRRARIADRHGLSAGHHATGTIDALAGDLEAAFVDLVDAIRALDKVPVKRRAGKHLQRDVVLDLATRAGKIRDTLCVYGFDDPGEPPYGLG